MMVLSTEREWPPPVLMTIFGSKLKVLEDRVDGFPVRQRVNLGRL